MSKQETFGSPDYELIRPIISEILKEEYKGLIIAVETKDGIILKHISRNSKKLAKELQSYLQNYL